MRHSAEECGKRFSFDNTRFIAAVENPEQAYEAMCNEILKSTAENPLFIVAAGPMQVVGEALNRAFRKEPASLSYVIPSGIMNMLISLMQMKNLIQDGHGIKWKNHLDRE